MTKIKTALISVYDKTGLEDFARSLADRGVEILSTGGTLKFLEKAGIPVTGIDSYTGQEEILGGRVKTLHPRIFGGILANRSLPSDLETLEKQSIKQIDLVVVNLYPFRETIAAKGVTVEQAIEQIDIGGVSLIRAAAKNFADVYVVCSPDQYSRVKETLSRDSSADDRKAFRAQLAAQAFAQTAEYDSCIREYFENVTQESDSGETQSVYRETLEVRFQKIQDLRYGENPHQTAAFYQSSDSSETSVARTEQLHGKELSYNNIVDLDAALEIVRSFEEPVCSIIKHNNPCGVARAETLTEAYIMARDCDPVSAFGGVVGFNRELDVATAERMSEFFTEAVIAPSFSTEALEILRRKKNIRILETGPFTPVGPQRMYKSVIGGVLVQGRDLELVKKSDLKVVSKLQPTEDDIDALMFAWRIAKFVKSNAIIYTSRNATIGIGAGQMSRIDSTNIGAVKAQSPVRGAYMASDAFFPFRDNIDRAADIGIKAIIEPGGSVRDEEVITAADEHGIILLFTGMRHFRH